MIRKEKIACRTPVEGRGDPIRDDSVMNESWSEEMTACWERLSAYAFDDPDHQLNFTKRLARENDWSEEYASRTIDEYRRFCWLAAHAGHPVTPSDAVDQVWHLHLTYSRDYWERFCPDVLGISFHHGPTKGGPAEGEKYAVWYGKTLLSYQEAFGDRPIDVWPAPIKRFVNADQFVRVNRADVLVLPRPPITAHDMLLAALALLTLFFFALGASISSIQVVAYFLGLLTLIALVGFGFGVLRSPCKTKPTQAGHLGAAYLTSTGLSISDRHDSDCGGGCGGCGG